MTTLADIARTPRAEATLSLLWERIRRQGDMPGFTKAINAILASMRGEDEREFSMTQTVLSDPVLTQKVLRLANSATFAARAPITSVSHAATMLGMSRVRSVLMTAVARQVFISRNKRIREITSSLWSHSVAVASVARQIAVRAGFEELWPHMEFFLAGLQEPQLAVELEWTSRGGNRYRRPLWQALVHMSHHSGYHRGQLATMMRQLGHRPPSTDLIGWFQQHG